MHTDKHPFLCVNPIFLLKYKQALLELRELIEERECLKLQCIYIDVTVHCTRLGGVRLVDLSERRTCKYMKLCPSGAATPTPRCVERVDVVETAQQKPGVWPSQRREERSSQSPSSTTQQEGWCAEQLAPSTEWSKLLWPLPCPGSQGCQVPVGIW